MDPVQDIKARLTIEELVGRYCQLQKKGRNFVCLCPFHSDTHPSLVVSPDKGIAYCFACQSGGDIFSFYQKIEGVDFPTALKDLAERAGVTLPRAGARAGAVVTKDEKQRLRECLEAAHAFYRDRLASSEGARAYIATRGVTDELLARFELGYAPDSFSETYEHLLKKGFSRTEILAAGLGVQRELTEERIYDRFRNRLIFPIMDAQGGLIAFGGRTLGDDDAKYINSSESVLYHKGSVLFGLHLGKESIRTTGSAVVVEGYFDLLACHKVGVQSVVATSGTALTQQHAKLLKRYAETVILCLDSDAAGREAAERAFPLLSAQDLHVSVVRLPGKDPDETASVEPGLLRQHLTDGDVPYLDAVLQELRASDLSSPQIKRESLRRVFALLAALPLAVEREGYVARLAPIFATTETTLREDLTRASASPEVPKRTPSVPAPAMPSGDHASPFSKIEITLALFLLYPHLKALVTELIPPEEGFAAALYNTLRAGADGTDLLSGLPDEHRERAGLIQLYCEHHMFTDWSDAVAVREIRKNCHAANQEILRIKQRDIKDRLLRARTAGKVAEEAQLQTQYMQLLKVAKMAT